MIGRSETILKWALYAAVTAALLAVQAFLLQNLRLLSVMPFLYPVLAAAAAMYEGAFAGSVYALALGVACDLTLAAPIPCFYTLIFPLVGLCAGLISRSWLPAGHLCALVLTVLAFFLTDAFHAVVMALSGAAAWSAACSVFLRETALTLPFVPLVVLAFRAVYQKCHVAD